MNFITNVLPILSVQLILLSEVTANFLLPRKFKSKHMPRIFDECNPPYWYPRHRPKYCERSKNSSIENIMLPFPPLPVPQSPLLQVPLPVPMPFGPPPFAPYGPYQNPLLPYSPAYRQQASMVPGLPGIVSDDGGINIMPFSDAYSDLLEKHKNKMVRRKLQRIIDKYEKRDRRWKYGKYLSDFDYY